ncbi:MAG TPA: hypothetical protein VMH30_05870 [Verrucomicrobiae bacterium]|nr:hypothetical protein [Verrucomicrobiae bacterium]
MEDECVSSPCERQRGARGAQFGDVFWCDSIAAGSPTHMGTITWQMKRWWDTEAQPLADGGGEFANVPNMIRG